MMKTRNSRVLRLKDKGFTLRLFGGESGRIMKKAFSVVIAGIVLGFILDKGVASAKPYFDIRSIGSSVDKDFAFIKIRYRCNLRKVKTAELKIYGLLKKGRDETVVLGTFSLNEIEKGRHKETFMIYPAYIKEHGSPRALRAEIWYKDKIRATKTKPPSSLKRKWWKKDAINIIKQSDKDIERLIRDD